MSNFHSSSNPFNLNNNQNVLKPSIPSNIPPPIFSPQVRPITQQQPFTSPFSTSLPQVSSVSTTTNPLSNQVSYLSRQDQTHLPNTQFIPPTTSVPLEMPPNLMKPQYIPPTTSNASLFPPPPAPTLQQTADTTRSRGNSTLLPQNPPLTQTTNLNQGNPILSPHTSIPPQNFPTLQQSIGNAPFLPPPPQNIQNSPSSVAPPSDHLQPPISSPISPPSLTNLSSTSAIGGYQPNSSDSLSSASQKKVWKIDPSQMPSPNLSTKMLIYRTKDSVSPVPPPAYSNFLSHDNGNCSPRFIRSCFNQIPMTKELLKISNLPFAAVMQPLSSLRNGEEPIPSVDFGEQGPIRCRNCRGYINHYVPFTSNGNVWVCNLCRTSNEVPFSYYCSLDGSNNRRDASQRPELSKGTVDLIVGDQYCIRPAQQPIFVFVIDISQRAIDSGLIPATLEAVRRALRNLPQGDKVRAGIVTFNSTVHFYSIKDLASNQTLYSNLPKPQIKQTQSHIHTTEASDKEISVFVVSDVLDPFNPISPGSWLLPVYQYLDVLEKMVDLISTLIPTSLERIEQSAATAALRCVVDGLEALGGQVILFCSEQPTYGFGSLVDREVKRNYASTQEKEMYISAFHSKQKQHRAIGELYRQFGEQCAAAQISIHCIAYSPEIHYFDTATFGELTQTTGGQLCFYPLPIESESSPSTINTIADAIINQVSRIVSRDIVFEAVIKVRCSQGLACVKLEGPGLNDKSPDELEIASVNSDTTVLCRFVHEGEKLKDGDLAFLQVALLCTRVDGQRMVRVHNLKIPVTGQINTVLKFSDLDAVVSSVIRESVLDAYKESPMAVRERLVGKIVDILFNYRSSCAANASTGQLILPESLKLLPMYSLGIIKHPAFRVNEKDSARPGGIPDPRADKRAYLLQCVTNLPIDLVSIWLYPRLYIVHQFSADIGTEDFEGNIILPKPKKPTSEYLSLNGIFLIDDGMSFTLYIGSQTSQQLLQEFFNISVIEEVSQLTLFEGSERAQQLLIVIKCLTKHRPYVCPLHIIYADHSASLKNSLAFECLNRLVLDKTKHDMSYDDFLYTLHRHIQNKLL